MLALPCLAFPSTRFHALTDVTVQTGAGISTSAGIPDFRSPNTGLYANLARLNLPYAEAVFDISYFRQNPTPFYTLAHELYPGKYRPTVTHSFIRLLHDKGLLLKLFTQNIDCLEREAGVPGDKIIEAHGSFASQSCIDCKSPYPDDKIKEHIMSKTIPRCLRSTCGGLVKPDIVFFGERLPSAFHDNIDLPSRADLCIVMGTSLTVQPFASLPGYASDGVPRLLINQEQVGGMGSRTDDVLLLGDCDDGVRKLAKACGWAEDLEEAWAKTAAPSNASNPAREKEEAEKSKDEKIHDEVEQLTKDIDKTLDLNRWHEDRVRKEDLGEKRESKIEEDKSASSKEGDIKPLNERKETDEKTLRYDEKGNDGLGHVFGHIDKKSSL